MNNLSRYNTIFRGQSQSPFPTAPTNLVSAFTVDTISGDLSWTDNTGGAAQYEIYSNINGAGAILLGTTIAGATSYSDTTCKQNASVVYSIRAKKGSGYSDYVTATALSTPLCFKTDQSTLNQINIELDINTGKNVNINWGDSTNNDYTGTNIIAKDYIIQGVYNISLTGDLNSITKFTILEDSAYGDLSNYVYPTACIRSRFTGNFTGDLVNFIFPNNLVYIYLDSNNFVDINIPQSVNLTFMNYNNNNINTAKIDIILLKLANFYQNNPPTANTTFNLSGANMGIPTGGASNTDIIRLAGYYTAAGKTATIVVTTS